MRNRQVTAFLAVAILVVTACGGAGTATTAPAGTSAATPTSAVATTPATSTPAATSPAASASATAAASPSGAASPSASPGATVSAECTKPALTTLTADKLTIGAENPAFPPYYSTDPPDPAWEIGNPTNGKGLEGETAYAVAKALGYEPADVTWAQLPFNNAIQPGKKAFDIYLTQVSHTPERAEAVDLSDGYFDVNQAVVTLQDSGLAKATKFGDLRAYRFGTQTGTTSYRFITDEIQPQNPPRAYDSMDAAIAGLKAKQIDGVIADLPTAFYMRDAQLDGKGVIVGTLTAPGEVPHFSILLTKGSPLTACVNQALAAIKADGTLKRIVDQNITNQGVPVLPG